MVHTFKTSPTNIISTQPITSGEQLILRSTSASDTAVNYDLTGTLDDDSPGGEQEALTGKLEVASDNIYKALGSITLSNVSAVGTVTIYGQGVAGTGDIRVNTNPADASTIGIGLTGFVQTYTFKTALSGTYASKTVSASGTPANNDTVTISGRVYTFKTALTGAAYEVHINGQDGSLTNLQSAINASGGVAGTDYGTGTVASVYVTAGAVSSHAITLTSIRIGSQGNSITLAKSGTNLAVGGANLSGGGGDVAFEVKIGATTSATASNLYDAIENNSQYGITYGTGTYQNPLVSATVLTNVVTLTDRMAIGRQLPWANTQSSTYFTIRQIAGATTGRTIGTLRVGVTQLLSATITLDTEDLADATLPAGVTPVSDWVRVGGKRFTIALSTAQTASALAFKYQTSNTKVTARDGDTSISITTTSGTLSNRDKLITPTEVAEYVRLVVTSNPNVLDTAVNAKLIA